MCHGHEVKDEWSCISLLTCAWERTSYCTAQGRHVTLDTVVSYEDVIRDVMLCSLSDMYQGSQMNPLHSSS